MTNTEAESESGWYWDLRRAIAVPAAERGNSNDMLGPYRTRGEAENWKATAEQRNDAWDDADEAWDRAGDDPPAEG